MTTGTQNEQIHYSYKAWEHTKTDMYTSILVDLSLIMANIY